MEPLKEMFNAAYVNHLALQVQRIYPGFRSKEFAGEVLQNLPELELNQRLRLISSKLAPYLPSEFETAVNILKRVVPQMKPGYTNLIFPDFVAQYGKSKAEISLEALAYFTTFGSSEFAVREFLLLDLKKTLQVMKSWAKDKNEHVRRLASEGSRPRLPWSFKLDAIVREPELTFPILELLKSDESLYVRKSVANHLNDVSKDQPEKLLRFIRKWDDTNGHTAWIIKRACRSLIKKGDPESLKLFRFEAKAELKIASLRLNAQKIHIGEQMQFSFQLHSLKKREQKLVVDYVIHHRGKDGQALPKVYKLKEISLKPGVPITLEKKHWFKPYSTRKQYPGKHKLEIQVNGKVMASAQFALVP